MTRALALTLLLFAAILGVARLRYSPPAPRPTTAPSDTFSASRARLVQAAIAGAGTSRAIGTDDNATARAFLEGQLRGAGFTTEVQRVMSCSRHGACAPVANVIGTRAGREPEASAVLLMAHYDSVACGPGASDDGMGTAAVIEAARAIGSSPPLRRSVVVVLTDGEEAGLLGAEAFMREHPLAATIRGAVNIDARGTAGPSAMFETSAGNSWVISLLAQNAERPVTSSLFYEVYRRMPNDTDFTSVKDVAHGMNFANIARVERYHTPLDSLDNADLGTLQHHGDQALAMVRALAESGPSLDAPRDSTLDAVWFDVLATFLVRWPATASLGLALAALALVLGWCIRMRTWGAGLAAPFAALLAAVGASLLVGAALKGCGAIPVPWVAHPLPALVSLHLACIGTGLGAGSLVARRARPEIAWAGTWLTWGLLGVASAVVAPGACFLFVVPTLFAGLVAWLRIDVAAIVPACVAAVLWMPLVILIDDALGLAVPALASISSAFLVTTLPSLISPRRWDRRLTVGAGAAVALTVLVAALVPVYSADNPQRVNVVFRQDEAAGGDTARARVYVEAAWGARAWGEAPASMLGALGDASKRGLEAPTPWTLAVPFAETERIAMEAPTATTLELSRAPNLTHVRARLESHRGARTLMLVLPEARSAKVTVEGQRALPRKGALVLRAVPAGGVEIAIDAHGEEPIALTLLDITSGLPGADAAPLAQAVRLARPTAATQTQEGDITITARHFQL